MARGLHVREVLEYEIFSDPPSREYVFDLQVITYQYMGLWVLEKEIFKWQFMCLEIRMY